MSDSFVDPLQVYDRHKKPTDSLRDLLRGTKASFLVCGGPSLNSTSAEHLNKRGVFSMAVNNVAGHWKFKPSAFVCSDPPSKFHTGIWLDPTILKLIPRPKFSKNRGKVRVKNSDESFEKLGISTLDCPNVWSFDRRQWFQPDETFFEDSHASWGNLNAGVERTGQPKTVCTMLLAMRLLHYLGSRRIYLVGVDFFMDSALPRDQRYAFPQDRDQSAVDSNNNQFKIVNGWLCKMEEDGVFRKYNLEIFNCTEISGLRAFPYVPFEEAVADCLYQFPEEPFDLAGWYEKK